MKKEDIKKAHCLFEQSGTFKNEFIKMGIPAYDYDIQNNFGQTDFVIDLFAEIEKGYNNEPSIFEQIGGGDIIMAFFPCIYFESMSMMYFDCTTKNNKNKKMHERIADAIKRLHDRTYFHEVLYKLFAIAYRDGLRLCFENPVSRPNYLLNQNFFYPQIVDNNRMLRGDFFVKPTGYWFINITPTHGFTYQLDKPIKRVCEMRGSGKAGLCSEERSMISPDYARNFLNDFIFGDDDPKQLSLF